MPEATLGRKEACLCHRWTLRGEAKAAMELGPAACPHTERQPRVPLLTAYSSLSRDFGADFRSLLSPPGVGGCAVSEPFAVLSLSRARPRRPRRRTVLSINRGKRSCPGAWSAAGLRD